MLEDTIKQIESMLARADMTEDDRKRLEQLFSTLHEELRGVSEDDMDNARSVARFGNVSAFEATRPDRDDDLLGHALAGFRDSARRIRAQYPKAVETVNEIANILSQLGI